MEMDARQKALSSTVSKLKEKDGPRASHRVLLLDGRQPVTGVPFSFFLRVNRATFSFCYFKEGRRHRRHLLDGLNAAMPQCLFLTWKRQMRRRDPSEVAWQSVIIAMEKHIIVETAALLRKVAFVSLCNSREGNYSGPAGNSKDEEEEMKKEQRGSSGYDVSLIG